MMRTSRTLRGRRPAHRRSLASRHRGKVILTLLALGGAMLGVYVPRMGFSAGLAPVLELASLTVAAVCGSSILVALILPLLPEKESDADLETAAWFRTLAAEGSWWEEPTSGGWSPAANVAVPSDSVAAAVQNDHPSGDAASSAVVADLRAQVDALQAALEGQAAELLAAQRTRGKEHDEIRADERLRVLVALRATWRRAMEDVDASPTLQEVALRMEAVVARLDSPWTAGRPVPPLPIDALVPWDVPTPEAAAVPHAQVADSPGTDELPDGPVFARGEVISPPTSPRAGASAPRTPPDRRPIRQFCHGAVRHARRLATVSRAHFAEGFVDAGG
jgi:hypothetical protein